MRWTPIHEMMMMMMDDNDDDGVEVIERVTLLIILAQEKHFSVALEEIQIVKMQISIEDQHIHIKRE